MSLLALTSALAACSARSPARDATYGFMDALERPPPGDRLAASLRTLLQRYVDRALQAGPPKDPSDVVATITGKAMKELAAHTPEQRAIVSAIVNEAVETALRSTKRGLPALFGTGLPGASERANAAPGPQETQVAPSPLAGAIAQTAEHAAGALVRGAYGEVRAELESCTGEACGLGLVRVASREAARGVIEGVSRSMGLWLVAIAFVVGGALTGAGAWIVHALRRRPAS